MPVPVWVPGQILTSSDINNWLAPQNVSKQADQSVTSSTTLVNDTELMLPIVVSQQYNFQCYLNYEGGTQGSSDIKVQWGGIPAGATLRFQLMGIGTAGGMGFGNTQTASNVVALGSQGAGVLCGVFMYGNLLMGTTPGGPLQLKWAQNTSSGTATIVHAQSTLTLQRTA